ncbi:hypothetical protein WICPIJ_005749 [Wickerhamomyces pijperi]|uniref:RecA family profile 1 domain-containing protein n=1 Tax=Wickerhamomyces pijperi TaxID=599730 RepID=A0A9P8Q529_WICPI|nr:hypothetical protein WICPIJ_005749 [Wickerhamomyces pijperi]
MDFYDQFPNSPLNFDENFESLFQIFSQHKVTLFELLTLPTDEILKKTTGSISVIQLKLLISLLKAELFAKFNPQPPQQDHLLISTGLNKVDAELLGGLSGLVEIFGESSTGKSQMCFQMMKTTSSSGHKCVYISTEGGNFQSERLLQMGADLKNIFMINCHDLESQDHIINYQLPILLKQHTDIRLVIVDSISHHIRVELNPSQSNYFQDYVKTQNYISKLSKRLLSYIDTYNVTILLTNQISSKPVKKMVNSKLKMLGFDYQLGWLVGLSADETTAVQENIVDDIKIPTIGLNLWNSCNTRICLRKRYGEVQTKRSIILYHETQPSGSPSNFFNEIQFQITGNGLECIE